MFGMGSSFKSESLNSFGKVVADYLHTSGELVLIRNPIDGIPLTHQIEEDNSSHKQIKAMTRFMFDCGAIWCMAYVCLRDEEYKSFIQLGILKTFISLIKLIITKTFYPKFTLS